MNISVVSHYPKTATFIDEQTWGSGKIPYYDMDKEMVCFIRAMNSYGTGIKTIDSCFGHPERLCNNDDIYVGYRIVDERNYFKVWDEFFRRHVGKIDIGDGYYWFSRSFLVDFHMYRLNIRTLHKAWSKKGKEEKLAAIRFLIDYLRERKWRNKGGLR